MENKNFEEKASHEAPIELNYSETSACREGYNTCLDRTNAKGIYEALKYAKRFLNPKEVDMNYIETELKKAEL